VLLVLLDDVGFGASIAFGGPVNRLIELEAGEDSHDHLIDPAQFLHFVMAKR
jgi:hypothetical protein